MRAKILFSAVSILNERIALDSMRIENLQQAKAETAQALAICENTVSNNEKAIEGYKAINANDKKKGWRRSFYFGAGGVVAGFVAGLLVR